MADKLVSIDDATQQKGDLIAATGTNTVGRLPVGADETFLVADSTQGTGMRWSSGSPVSNGGGVSSVRALTQAEYDAIGSKDTNTLYVILP